MSNFFDTNSYFIDEKVNFLKFENSYKVFNETGEQIGAINQKLSGSDKFLRLFLSKAMLPFHLDIVNANNEIQASVKRGWTFFMSKIIITDAAGVPIGTIKQKFTFMKPNFQILDNMGQYIGEISGDWKAWNFIIKDGTGAQIGVITKKWAGAVKEFFTTADKYNVNIDPSYSNTGNKIKIIAAAITIDMVLKESKS